MNKVTIRLMIITLISKLFGFARDITLSYFYGASAVSDAYLISLTLPETIFGFVAAGISTGYIPLYTQIVHDQDEDAGNIFTNNLMNIVFFFSLIVLLVTYYFTPQLIDILAAGFDGETRTLAVILSRISIFSIYFTAMISLFSGFLQIKGKFEVPALIGFPLNIITVISIVISYYTNVRVLGFGMLLAVISQVLILLPFVFRSGYKYLPYLNIKDPGLLRLITIALPVIFGTSVNQINVIVDKTIASSISVGGISSLNYGYMIVFFVQGLFVLPITQIMYPTISVLIADHQLEKIKKVIAESVVSVFLLVIPATVGLYVLSRPIIELLYGRGNFDEEAIQLTTSALSYYTLGIVGFGLRELYSRAFYALQDSKTPMINATIGVVINIVLNLLISQWLGIGGLALATSISASVTSFLLIISLRKRIGNLGMKTIISKSFIIIISSLVMGIGVHFLYQFMMNRTGNLISLFTSVLIGTIIYLIMLLCLGFEDVSSMIKRFNNGPKKN